MSSIEKNKGDLSKKNEEPPLRKDRQDTARFPGKNFARRFLPHLPAFRRQNSPLSASKILRSRQSRKPPAARFAFPAICPASQNKKFARACRKKFDSAFFVCYNKGDKVWRSFWGNFVFSKGRRLLFLAGHIVRIPSGAKPRRKSAFYGR